MKAMVFDTKRREIDLVDMTAEDEAALIASSIPHPPTAEQTRVAAFDAAPEAIDLATRARTATNAQVDAWLLANMTTIAQTRGVLGAVIKRLIAKGLL